MQAVTPVSTGIDRSLSELLQFTKDHPRVSYGELDAHMLGDLRLFGVPKDAYFRQIEGYLDAILHALPAIKRIFAKPIVRLKDVSEIVPAEMARIINSHTISHASNHSELWDDITEEGVKPRRLMTVGRTETYAIYENIVFARTVDSVLRFLRTVRDLLKDVLYNCRDMQFNLLDRTHHQSFFLALGKLYVGYSSALETQYASYFRCMEKINFIEKVLRARLHLPVYAQCKKRGGKAALKKTSIFRVHKDYREVYRLARRMEDEIELKELMAASDENFPWEEYRAYAILLSIFAAGHFNLAFSKEEIFDFAQLQAVCHFKDWRLALEAPNGYSHGVLVLRFQKEISYTVCLILAEKKTASSAFVKQIRQEICADEYLFANAREYGEEGVVYLSPFNIDSFRRFQQIFLRGMILSDTKRETCPFCGNGLERRENLCTCGVCRAEIKEMRCPDTGEPYVISGIQKYAYAERNEKKRHGYEDFLHDRYLEASLHFRNITPLSPDGNFVCPRCGKVHE